MYISNINDMNGRYYECNKLIGNYLIKKGFPLLSRNRNKMVFARTNRLNETLDKMPMHLIILEKVGV